ncbi:MAG: hypothetical protein IJT16_10785, partial [Lachnospiraceae bacterium]|nr:hypothetical protein [Lachnospiraceae bacterium]
GTEAELQGILKVTPGLDVKNRKYADNVMNVFTRANEALMRKSKEGNGMCEAINELFAEETAAERKRADEAEEELVYTMSELNYTRGKLTDTEGKLTDTEGKLTDTESKLTDTESKLTDTESKLIDMESRLKEALAEIVRLKASTN